MESAYPNTIDPNHLILITDKNHALYDPRVEIKVDRFSLLYQDIAARGVERPITVRLNTESNLYEVVDGRQRTKIAQHCKLESVPIHVVQGDDRVMVLRGLSGNLLSINETPFTIASKMHKAQKLGCSVKEIATASNFKSPLPIKMYLSILSFEPKVQAAFNGKLPLTAAPVFEGKPPQQQLAILAKLAREIAQTGKAKVKSIKLAAGEKIDDDDDSPDSDSLDPDSPNGSPPTLTNKTAIKDLQKAFNWTETLSDKETPFLDKYAIATMNNLVRWALKMEQNDTGMIVDI